MPSTPSASYLQLFLHSHIQFCVVVVPQGPLGLVCFRYCLPVTRRSSLRVRRKFRVWKEGPPTLLVNLGVKQQILSQQDHLLGPRG